VRAGAARAHYPSKQQRQQEVATISEFLIVVLVILAFLLLLGGIGIFLIVKLAKKAANKAREATARITTHVNAMGTGDAAEVERLRLEMRREVSLTRQSIEQAQRQGWDLGELPRLLADLTAQADVHDQQLGMYAQQRRMSSFADHATLDRLRQNQATLTAMCARLRSDLLHTQVRHTGAGIADLTQRADLEIEARRPAPDPLDEIDDLYRRTMQERKDLP
jgi:predicted negative regulator of RcsB-dependent stress response